jgi:hypothetical protein
MASATLTSKPFLVFKPYRAANNRFSLSYPFHFTSAIQVRTHGSNGGTTLSQHAQPGDDILDPLDTVSDLLNVSAELLSERKRGSVLQVGSTDLDNRLELGSLGLKGVVQLVESRQEGVVDLDDGRDVHGGGEAADNGSES